MDCIKISIMPDKDFFIHIAEDYYMYHTAEEVLDMFKRKDDVYVDLIQLEKELKKMCFKHGCKLR